MIEMTAETAKMCEASSAGSERHRPLLGFVQDIGFTGVISLW
jgi:hypothetical protein